jgi:hypothetical protein
VLKDWLNERDEVNVQQSGLDRKLEKLKIESRRGPCVRVSIHIEILRIDAPDEILTRTLSPKKFSCRLYHPAYPSDDEASCQSLARTAKEKLCKQVEVGSGLPGGEQ